MDMDIRWQQRYENFQKATKQLTLCIESRSLNTFERLGLIKIFEYTFELGWKTMKDYLQYQGLEIATPRQTIQMAFNTGLIQDGHAWIDALEKRNLMAHTYNEAYADEAEQLIRSTYYAMILALHRELEKYLSC